MDTQTPGMFYHGSPDADLAQFKSQFELSGRGRKGIYFTQIPTNAAIYAVSPIRGGGHGGRIHRVEIITQRQLFAPDGFWSVDEIDPDQRDECIERREIALEDHGFENGHDCIVSDEHGGLISEIVVLDPTAIRRHSSTGPVSRAADMVRRDGIVFADSELPGPDFAPDCPLLFADDRQARENVQSLGLTAQYGLFERKLIFCDHRDWPLMDMDRLRSAAIDCLVDPNDGRAIMIEPALLAPLHNRSARREYSARRQAGWRKATKFNGPMVQANDCFEQELQLD